MGRANGKDVRLSATGGRPSIEIIIGYEQRGGYYVYLWDRNNKNPEPVGEGLSRDDQPDVFEVQHEPTALDKRALSWQGAVTASDDSPDQPYSVITRIYQDAAMIAEFESSGSFQGSKSFMDFVRFVL